MNPAELNEQAVEMLPVSGKIKERFLFSKEKLVTPEIIRQQIDFDIPEREQQMIQIERHVCKISKHLQSTSTQQYLRIIQDAPNENLAIEQSVMVVEAFWQLYARSIFLYSLIFWLNYVVIVGYIIFGLESVIYSYVVGGFSVLMILVEFRQMKTDPDYFKSAWNWLDLSGSLGVIIHVVLRCQGVTMDK